MSNHKQDKVNTDLQQKINDLEQDRFQVSFNSTLTTNLLDPETASITEARV